MSLNSRDTKQQTWGSVNLYVRNHFFCNFAKKSRGPYKKKCIFVKRYLNLLSLIFGWFCIVIIETHMIIICN